RHQREKLAVLSAFAGQALLVRPGYDASGALARLAAQAALEHPAHFAWNGRHASALGVRVHAADGSLDEERPGPFGLGNEVARCLRGLPPTWRLAGLLSLAFEEDFALLDGRDGTVPWLAVALPSHWAPEEKVGHHFRAVHAPVADNGLLMAAGDRLPALVSGPSPHERFVWSLATHPRLHAHPQRAPREPWPKAGPEEVARAAWWRTERQTFLPLPPGTAGAPSALFTIAVQVSPFVLAMDDPDRARRLHDALASMSPAVRAYRGLDDAAATLLLAWLHARARR
ncbi:MAG: hypothetical protein RI988_2953, partial [Pseudomonadota bacterium]